MAKRKPDSPTVDVAITIRSGGDVKCVSSALLSFASVRSQRKLVRAMREAADVLEHQLGLIARTTTRKARSARAPAPPPRRRPSAAVVN